jgi:cyclophilin family peptidyl-prolyl cis-trans isomerase/HEAT repeat protein
VLSAWWLAAVFAAAGVGAAPPRSELAERHAIIAAEDARAPTQASLDVLLAGAHSSSATIQRLAVRALGRLERPELADTIAPLMAARNAAVRAEAANALGQAMSTRAERAGPVSLLIIDRLKVEKDQSVRGSLCETLGRLPYAAADDVQRAEAALYDATWRGEYRWTEGSSTSRIDPAPLPALSGAVKGLESLYRLRAKLWRPSPLPLVRLRVLAIYLPKAGQGAASPGEVSLRRLATAALVAGRVPDAATFGFLAKVPDPQTRRLAAIGLTAGDQPDPGAKAIVRQLLVDPSPLVRYEALRAFGRHWRADGCAQIVNAVADSDHVALLALDLLAQGCPAAENVGAVLMAIADRIGRSDAAGRNWHRPAHAIVSLARIDKPQAAKRLTAFVEHPVWQVRMYAARAAALLEDEVALRQLAGDAQDNVREAAVSGLSRVAGHRADDVYLAALERPDYQLVMTTARALGGSPNRERAVPALLAALARLTAQGRDTSRDPRVALLERLRELGSAAVAGALDPYVADFDSRVARLAADTLSAWTGTPHAPETATTRLLSPPPSADDLRAIAGLTARVTVRGLGSFDIGLLADDAPAAVTRFAQLARAGYYNGLTFHRVVPNFVVQGGSPGANEYVGDGAYMRDELGLVSNLRGSVGISTRGRDTGDAQIYVNLLDNIRLDHDYTVFGRIFRGMDIADGLLEGDVIERVEIIAGSCSGG